VRYNLARPWTPEDVEELRRLVAANFPKLRIAARLKRTIRGIETKARTLGLKLPPARARRIAQWDSGQ
jgi:hypothetical protein